MYAYLDRPVADLPAGERLFLDAMRGWAFARTMGRDARATLAARLPLLGRSGALDPIDAAMTALDGGSDDVLAFQRPCHDTVDEIEAVLLAIVRQAGDGRVAHAAAALSHIVDARAADRIAILLADAARRAAPALAGTARH